MEAADAAPVLSARSLVKDYGRVRALHHVDLSVRRGEVFGFIGPNGAGKSTFIRCALDLIRPTAGEVSLLGERDLKRHPELRARIGYLPGELAMGPKLTPRQHLDYLCALRGGRGQDQIEPLAARFKLDLDRPVRGLSKGNKQKVGVVQAFMHAPELLVLDEPTSGLDPLLQQEFLGLVGEAQQGGATLFVSSHILSELEAVAERVGFLRDGRVIAVEEVARLRARAGQHIAFAFADALPAATATALEAMVAPRPEDGAPDVQCRLEDLVIDGREVRAVLYGPPDPLLKLAASHTVTRWAATDRNLEELFMHHYEGAPAEGQA